ncbi:MAG: sulfatase-like hydrolase/transferase [Fuerstiella sp.]|nr:sulfatase-like hydrolase/transferase [Fuerstiella sp.]MCP4784717.1 sulfatase-like hydrolase/transferase [Fuerstiella sp.]MCP4853464.1 sulfatase-like hydrolase/transferase [Fuerstiella sp.]
MSSPNILWLCTDQQRFDTIRSLGNDLIRTPNIDRLVHEGVAFTQAYCQSPVCSPSRASFLTGRYPRTTRCRQNGQTIPADEVLVSRMFADAGYRCGLAGKLHLASCSEGKVEERIDDGYDDFYWSHHPQPDWPENAYTQWLQSKGQSWEELYSGPSTGYVKAGVPAEFHQTTWCADMAIDFIRSNEDRPWFFSFNCFDPHHAFDPPPEYMAKYNPDDMPLPKAMPGELESKTTFQRLDSIWAHNSPGEFHTAAITDNDRRQVTAAYYAMCELIDDQVGRIMHNLEQSGQRENTIVIFMSDHGEMLGDHGIYFKGPHFYDEAIRVPLVMSWLGQFQSGLRVEGLTELIDLVPTLLEAADLELPERVQGKSLLPHLTGKADPAHHRDAVFCEYYNSWTHSDAYGTMLRTTTEKIVVYHGTDQGELYDLKSDPDEFTNLWTSPDHQSMKLQLMQRCFDASVLSMDPCPPRRGAF